MGGEKSLLFAASRASVGSPPRGRGKGVPALEVAQHIGITPAWAGKSAGERQRPPCPPDHPRTGGEKMHLSLTLAHDTLHALTQFFNRVAFVDKLQNRSE